jgi:hypothetical protein
VRTPSLKGSRHILFTYVPEFKTFEAYPPTTGFMLEREWERAGYEPFDILEALAVPKEKAAA